MFQLRGIHASLVDGIADAFLPRQKAYIIHPGIVIASIIHEQGFKDPFTKMSKVSHMSVIGQAAYTSTWIKILLSPLFILAHRMATCLQGRMQAEELRRPTSLWIS